MSACAVRTKEIGGLALLGERYRRFGRSACCGGVLSSKGRGGVKCKARALGTIALLKRLSLAALGIDPKALKASRTIDPLPLPSLDSAKHRRLDVETAARAPLVPAILAGRSNGTASPSA